MANLYYVSAGCVFLFLAGCSYGDKPADVLVNAADMENKTAAPDCAAFLPEDGKAEIRRLLGPDASSTLVVKFSFFTPSSGDKYKLEFSTSEESNPPTYVYNLVRIEVGSTDDVWKVEDFLYEDPEFSEPELLAVKIRCATFDEDYPISPVEIIQ